MTAADQDACSAWSGGYRAAFVSQFKTLTPDALHNWLDGDNASTNFYNDAVAISNNLPAGYAGPYKSLSDSIFALTANTMTAASPNLFQVVENKAISGVNDACQTVADG